MPLDHLPKSSRPREKLLAHGPGALSDAELLALLLRTGLAGRSVLQMAQDVLDRLGGVAGLLNADEQLLAQIKGLGPAKRSELLAVRELARRALSQAMQERPAMQNPEQVGDYLRLRLGALPYECFAVLFLDAQGRLIAMEELFRGTLSQAAVYPREVVQRALHHGAASVILSHNHPSGVAEPSQHDRVLTERLAAALALVDVRVLDHLVVSAGEAVSMATRGLI
ncbi:MAG: DNA repair protein RadC [Burkholderiales bacterium]|nr:DNA repair protein RadC [Burkholderiales bacterium]